MVLEELGCFTESLIPGRDLPFFIAGSRGWNGHSYNFCAGLCAAARLVYTFYFQNQVFLHLNCNRYYLSDTGGADRVPL